MFCPKCGKELSDTARFCGSCGYKLEALEVSENNSNKPKKVVKKFVIALFGCCVCLSILVYFDVIHMLHDWQEATCTEPKTCSKCGETEGEALGHSWEEVACTEPKTCRICGATEGEVLGHAWVNATCTEPQTCSRCHETNGEIGEHSLDSTGKCNFCNKQVGVKLDMSNYRQYLTVDFQLCHDNKKKTGCGWKVAVTPNDKHDSFQGVVIKYRVELTGGINRNHRVITPDDYWVVDVNERGYATYSWICLDDPNRTGTLDYAEVTGISGFVIE